MESGVEEIPERAVGTGRETDLAAAFRLSLPVLGAYLFLGATYGMLAASNGYAIWTPLAMAMVIYSGSVEFIALTMLLGVFDPLGAFVMAVMVGVRHLFYGLTMLDRWRGAGWRKPLLIFWMSDETFAVNLTAGGSAARQLWVSALDYGYWVVGAAMGFALYSCAGAAGMAEHLAGLDFAMTAMFVAIFMDDFVKRGTRSLWRGHGSALLGLACTAACLAAFGPERFIVPSMAFILAALFVKYRHEERRAQ